MTSWNARWKLVSNGPHDHFQVKSLELTTCGNLLASSRNANDNTLTPALVASFQSGTHHADITSAVEGVVAATIGHLDQLFLDSLAVELGRVDKVRGTELASPFLLRIVDIDNDDLASLVLDRTLDDGEANTSSAENSDVGALLNLRGHNGSTVTGCDTTAQKAGSVGGNLGSNSDDGDVGDNGVLREGRGAHEVEQVLATGLETRGAVRHHTSSLGSTDLAAQVGLAGLAKLAFPTLGGAMRG